MSGVVSGDVSAVFTLYGRACHPSRRCGGKQDNCHDEEAI
jgi:hypothetical protein